jgi:enoyl-CoA hydratase
MLTGRIIDADEADHIGLVQRVVPDDELLAAALETAGLIAANSPWGVRMTKEVLWSQLEVGGLAGGRHRPREPDPGALLHDGRHARGGGRLL